MNYGRLPTHKHLPLSVTNVWVLWTLIQFRHGVWGSPAGLCCTTYSSTPSETGGCTDHDTLSSWYFPLTSNMAACCTPTKTIDMLAIFPVHYSLQITYGTDHCFSCTHTVPYDVIRAIVFLSEEENLGTCLVCIHWFISIYLSSSMTTYATNWIRVNKGQHNQIQHRRYFRKCRTNCF